MQTALSASRMPVLFVGHGSPMNAVADNDYTRALTAIASRIPRPKAILCVSAHWQTEGTFVTSSPAPRTIHDFHGFPEELYRIRYPAPGAPELATRVQTLLPGTRPDNGKWGLDHGAWSILRHLYPAADIPVTQLSLDVLLTPLEHMETAKRLAVLRKEGVLIVGSGNVVHNLRNFSREEAAPVADWAVRFDEWVRQKIETRNFRPLATDFAQTPEGRLSVPSEDHYLPLLVILGAGYEATQVEFFYDRIQNGSIAMRSFLLD